MVVRLATSTTLRNIHTRSVMHGPRLVIRSMMSHVSMLQLVTSHKNFNEELMQISRHVENAEGYGRVTDVLFASAVTYGRLYVWKT